MRTVALCVVAALFAAGCAGQRPTLLEQSEMQADGMLAESSALEDQDTLVATDGFGQSTTEPNPADTFSTLAATAEGNIVEPSGGVRALISPTGVVVPVTGQADNGYVVTTPCGNESFLRWGQPLGQAQVVVDPGHGGDEQGAIGDNGLTEASLNLAVAKRVAAKLAADGVSVVLTRSGDYRLPITQRATIADALGADAFVSIHHNTPAAAASNKPGTEVYVQSQSLESSRLGGLIYENVVSGLDRFDVRWVARADAGVLSVLNTDGEDAYGINRHPSVPSVLVEVAYLGNPLEARLMESEQYVNVVGVSIADGIGRYLLTSEPGSGFVDQNRTFDPSGATGGTQGCVDPELE